MRDPRSVALHLAAWAREERAAQEEAVLVLRDQERAVRARDLDALEAASRRLEELGRRGALRARRRDRRLADLARIWSVPASALTLGSVAERLGSDGAELAELRGALRQGAAELLRVTRRVGALVAAFRRVAGEVVELLLTDEDGTPLHAGGGLVDAEA